MSFDMRQWARYYAARGWAVFPLAPSTKRPLTERGCKDASTNPAQIDAWWAESPDANIGIATGAVSGLYVVDLDDKEGREGSVHWANLCTEHGGDGTPIEAYTGSGGTHLFYSYADGLRNSAGKLGPGIDTRGEGGYVVAAPSLHPNGQRYSWAKDALNGTPSAPPPWVVERLKSHKLKDAAPVALEGSYTVTSADLEAFIDYKSRFQDAAKHVAVARAVLDGVSWGKGSRHTAMVSFLGSLRTWVADKHHAAIDPEGTSALFDACCAAATTEGVNSPTDRYWVAGLIRTLQQDDAAYRGRLEAARAEKAAEMAELSKDTEAFMADVDARMGSNLREMLARPSFDADPVDPNPVIDAIIPLLAAKENVFCNNENKLARVVRIKGDASLPVVIEPATNDWLRPTLCEVARWTKPVKDGDKPVPASRDFTAMVLTRRDYPGIREIRGITMSPFFREDGTLVTRDGYDAASGTWLALQGLTLPAIQDNPTLEEAKTCIAKLKSLIVDFNFGDPHQSSVWLSTVLTALVRPLRSPMHLFNAANPGTGKGLICATAMAIVFGTRRVVQNWTMSEEENEKRLVSLAVQGSPVVWIDNVAPNCVLGGAALEGGITEGSVGRELGSSKNAPALNNVTFLANGNNVRLTRDMSRRTLRAELVATCADPSSRPVSSFRVSNLLEHVQAHQAEYLAAALTVLRAYFAAGRPKQDVRAISFPEWSGTVASVLVWVGEPDPSECSVMLAEQGAVDEATEALTTLCDVIRKLQGDGRIKPGQLLQMAPTDSDHERVMEALEVMGLRSKDADAAKVGRLLKSRERSIVRLDNGSEVQLLKEKNTRTGAWEYRVAELKRA